MEQRKKYVTAAVTLVVTGALAHLMQTSQKSAPPRDSALNSASIFAVPTSAPNPSVAIGTPAATLAPEPSTPALDTVALDLPSLDTRTEAAPAETELALIAPDAPAEELEPPASRIDTIAETPDVPLDIRGPDPLEVPVPSPQDRLAAGLDDAVGIPDTPKVSEFGLACGAIMTAVAQPSAMIRLTVTAPCRGGEVITVRQGELSYTAELDRLGLYTASLPALGTTNVVDVTFADQETASEEVTVADAGRVERVVVQFEADAGLGIHALEFGSDYGDAGHVWAGNARDPDTALPMNGGFLTRLGEKGRIAEIYTLPTDTSGRDGVVRLSVEAEVTEANCGRDVAGQLIQRDGDGEMRPVALTLSMPGCDALGEFLVLKNLAWDLRIAANE